MSKRRDSPALFELVRTSGIQRPDPNARENPLREEPVAPTATPPPQTSSSAAVNEPDSFGRTIRLPMGYVFLAVAAMIVLLVLAYSVGFSRGRKEMPRRNDGAADLDQMQNERNLDGNDGSEDTSGPNEDLINPSEADIDLADVSCVFSATGACCWFCSAQAEISANKPQAPINEMSFFIG